MNEKITDNVIPLFPGMSLGTYDPESDDSIGAHPSTRQAHASVKANELFEIVMRTLDGTGAVDHFYEEDSDALASLFLRFVMLKEVLTAIYCYIDATEHELDDVIESMFIQTGVIEYDDGDAIGAQYHQGYLAKLKEMTQQHINELTNA